MNYELKIEKAKIVKNERLDLDFTKLYEGGEKNPASESFKAPMHPDCANAFKTLRPHLGLMAGFIKMSDIEDIENVAEEIISNLHIHGFSIGGDEDSPGVTLQGHIIIFNGKALNFSTPFYLIDENEATRYRFMDDLVAKLEILNGEILQYVDGTKRGEPAKKKKSAEEEEGPDQLDLFDKEKNEKITNMKFEKSTGELQQEADDAEKLASNPLYTPDPGGGVIVDPGALLAHINQNQQENED